MITTFYVSDKTFTLLSQIERKIFNAKVLISPLVKDNEIVAYSDGSPWPSISGGTNYNPNIPLSQRSSKCIVSKWKMNS